jgi:hypothetical protein
MRINEQVKDTIRNTTFGDPYDAGGGGDSQQDDLPGYD